MQNTGLSLTFARENFTPKQYLHGTHEDTIDVMYLKGCWSLTAKIENLLRKYNFKHEDSYFEVTNPEFLGDLHYLLYRERFIADCARTGKNMDDEICALADANRYYLLIESNLKDLEWLLFYIDGRIAASQLFEQLSSECFVENKREDWVKMCEAWGNDKPENFKLILWID